MMEYIQQLMTPQVMTVIYLFIAFIVALYVLSVVYVFVDARRRGSQYFWAWGLLSLVPLVGLIAYNVLRPSSYLSDREEQELDMALRERQLAQYGTCPRCGRTHREGFRRVPGVQHPGAQRLPQLPQAARRPLEGVPVLPNAHPIGAPPVLTGTSFAPDNARIPVVSSGAGVFV